ncbi:MAG: ATP-binding cassette domain-containing protein [Desulfamplus sp.]|nr:ATP-binding cassette domain-containing protein [Desulfamplus sp.]
MTSPLIQFVNIKKKFGTNIVMQGLDLSIHEGETTTIIGKSGTGKSVLLKHIIGLIRPDSGSILFAGEDIVKMGRKEIRKFKQNFSYMFQENALFDSMTVYENIALPLSEKKVPLDDVKKKVKLRMEQMEISATFSKYPSQLSGGMKKRVALARALVTDPKIVLFDEPTTGLDPLRKNTVLSMIKSYRDMFGFTAVIVSHEIPDIFSISQRVAMLDSGKIIFQGTPEEIMASDEHKIRSFINGYEDQELE